MVDDRGLVRPDLSDDGRHPNARGDRLMAPVLAGAVEELLRPGPARPKPTLVK
jgi:lysophospholipase L1-like esterase